MEIRGVNHNLPMVLQGKGIHKYETKRLSNGFSVWIEGIESYIGDDDITYTKSRLEYLGKSGLLESPFFPDDEILAIQLATLKVGIVKSKI
jgi:hypothetical protein